MEEDEWEQQRLRKIARRVNVLGPTIEYFQAMETQQLGAYSLKSLDALFRARWDTVLEYNQSS